MIQHRLVLFLGLILAPAACSHPQHATRGGGGGGGGTDSATGPIPEAVRKTVGALLGADARIKDEHEDGKLIYEAKARTQLELELSDAGAVQKTEVALP